MKICFKCGEEKPLSQFYKHKQMADGHLNKCIECAKKDVRQHRRDQPERVRAYDRARSKLPHRVAMNVANTAAYRAEFPERYEANRIVGNALRDGVIKKTPCHCCGSVNVEGHHPDYSRPLDVVWLCVAHHRELHLARQD